jgi:integrase
MATIESYDTANGRRYRVRYRQPNHKQTKRRGFKTKRDAQEFASTVEVRKLEGAYVAPSLGRITVAEIAPIWLSRKQSDVAKSNYRTLEIAWRVHVAPRWGSVRLSDIDLAEVELWIADLRRKRGATTVIRSYGVLAGILDDAVKARRLRINPARGVENLPRQTTKRRVYLTADDVARLASQSKHPVLVLTLAYTGLRWGEAVALRVRDIDFLRRRIAVRDNAVQIGCEHDVGLTKSRKDRSVPVPQFVLDELSEQCRGRGMGDLVFGDGEHYLPRPKSSTGWFVAAVRKAQVQYITPHDLRHSCASLAISAGVNVLALARMLGHSSAKVTLDTYSDLFDADLDKVAEALDSRCAQSVPKHAQHASSSMLNKPLTSVNTCELSVRAVALETIA